MSELEAHIWWNDGKLFRKLPIKISTLISPIWMGKYYHPMREYAVKISTHNYLLVVPL